MSRYVVHKLLLIIPTLIGVTVITFLLLKAIPGDPVYGMVGPRASPEVIEAMRKDLGLDRGIVVQYCRYLRLLLKGDLGNSYYTGYPVGKSIIEKFPNTLKLAAAAMLFAVTLGIVMGILASLNEGGVIDRAVTVVSASCISTPVFWFGLILILVFATYLKRLPPAGMGNGSIAYLILPAVTLGTRSAAYIARVTRSSMLEVLGEPYIRTARAKGLGEAKVVLKHALKCALIPIITLIGVDFGSYLNGAVLTETIFGWDGLGRFAINGIFKRDYPVVLGTVLFGSLMFILANLIVDFIYRWVNPRVRL
ncbi:MAG: ABC transporter permease [Candidatus Tritonobacter lacicola]|nr:ABC transporter permease [Candidatus Tritonobacter lacicola]